MRRVAIAGAGMAAPHDYFTGIELISYEDLGFAKRFGARIGLAHNIGGPKAVAAVTILEGAGARG